jgi:hypothetical protein
MIKSFFKPLGVPNTGAKTGNAPQPERERRPLEPKNEADDDVGLVEAAPVSAGTEMRPGSRRAPEFEFAGYIGPYDAPWQASGAKRRRDGENAPAAGPSVPPNAPGSAGSEEQAEGAQKRAREEGEALLPARQSMRSSQGGQTGSTSTLPPDHKPSHRADAPEQHGFTNEGNDEGQAAQRRGSQGGAEPSTSRMQSSAVGHPHATPGDAGEQGNAAARSAPGKPPSSGAAEAGPTQAARRGSAAGGSALAEKALPADLELGPALESLRAEAAGLEAALLVRR